MAHWTDRFVGKVEVCPEKSDEEIAGWVRMLIRSDLDHEVAVVAARDRIARLSRQVMEKDARIAELRREKDAEYERAEREHWRNREEEGKWLATRDANQRVQAELNAAHDRIAELEGHISLTASMKTN